MNYHVYYTINEVRMKDIDIPSECLTDMKTVYNHLVSEISKDPKGGEVVDRGNLIPVEATIRVNAMEHDGVFFGF